MIADVRGYTRFTREHGDAAAARLAGRFADLARDAVEARGGQVLELRGDEALAVFDSTVQAVRAAIEFQGTCAEEYEADPTLPLAVGVGIDAGEAVPVEDGFRGVALNTAARLCANAAAGQVLVTEAVAAATSGTAGIRLESRGDATLKGFDGAVPLIEAIDERPETVPAPTGTPSVAEALAPELDPVIPLADRVREMRWLRGSWRQARRGRGRVLWISGPPQIGKTRLAAEVASMVHSAGGRVVYAGLGGTADANALTALRSVTDRAEPTLLVLDDVDAMGDEVVRALEDGLDTIAVQPILVVATIRALEVSPAIDRVVRRSDVSRDGHRRLGALGIDGVREIAAGYVDTESYEAPLEAFARASGGVPGRVHEVIGDWAREEASRRLAAAAEWLSEGRTRRTADLAFANNVIGLKLGRLYAPVEGDDLWVCPFKGLATFEETDAAYFFGRERLVGDLAARTVGAGLLGVIGASGSGKSSLVFAGLLPSLAAGLLPGSERWRTVAMRPGEHPLAELDAAVASSWGAPLDEALAGNRPEERLVLVVDQFEEVFTSCEDEEERDRFVAAVTGAARDSADRFVAVLTLRGDYYGHCARYRDLAELLATNQILVGSMTRDELRRAIELPARRVGLHVESALTDTLVDEIADQPGSLPLLSTALVELWQERDARWLRLEAYERTGGVRGAVARLADGSFLRLSDAQRDAARAVFLRLVAAGEAEGVARRRVRLDEFDLERDPAAAVALTHLTRDRLLTMDESTVEVSHEALLREWPRLQGWLEEDATGRQLRQHVTSSAKQWQAAGRDDSELYRGARLSAALDWSSGHERELNELERGFLSTSRRASERDAERQRRVNRRLRGSLVGVALLLALSIVAGSLALIQRGQARDAASRAARSAVTADAQRIGALALLEDQPDLALLLAVQGAALDPGPPETRGSLFETLMRFPRVLHVLSMPQRILRMATPARAGDVLAVADNTGRVFVYAVPSYEPIFEETLGDGVNQLAMSPDGRRLVASVPEKDFSETRIVALDVPSGDRAWSATVPTADFGTGRLSVSPDGTEVFWVSRGEIRFLDLRSGRPSRPPAKVRGESAWMLDRHRLLTVDDDRGGGIRDLRSGTITREIEFEGPRGGAQTLSPDGSMLALGGHDGAVAVLAVESGELVRMPEAHDGFVEAMVFSPDGSVLATAGEEGNVFLWDPATGARTEDLVGHSSGLRAAVFAERGATLVTGGLDSTVIAWDVAGDRAMLRTFDQPGPPCPDVCPFPMFAVTADGRSLAIPGADLRVRFIDTKTLRPAGALEEPGLACCQVAGSSPDGSKIATVFGLAEAGFPGPNAVSLWDVRSGALLRRLFTSDEPWTDFEHAPPLDTVAYAPDGSSVATNENERIVLLDPDTGETLESYEAPAFVQWLSYSPDGRLLQADMDGGLVAVWDLRTDRLLWSRKVDDQLPLGGEFAADGGSLILGSESGKIHLLDPRTGRPLREPLLAHDAYLASIAIHPDSTMFATSGTDGVTFLWDARTQRALGSPFGGPGGGGSWSRFSPDGRLLYVSTSERGFVFDTTLEGWIDRACAITGRTLTRAEWDRFLPERPYRPACGTT